MMIRRKKGQASAAAALIAIIAALIVLYILVIPPAERQKILEGEDYVSSTGEGNLLFELDAPTSFIPETDKEFQKKFPPGKSAPARAPIRGFLRH